MACFGSYFPISLSSSNFVVPLTLKILVGILFRWIKSFIVALFAGCLCSGVDVFRLVSDSNMIPRTPRDVSCKKSTEQIVSGNARNLWIYGFERLHEKI